MTEFIAWFCFTLVVLIILDRVGHIVLLKLGWRTPDMLTRSQRLGWIIIFWLIANLVIWSIWYVSAIPLAVALAVSAAWLSADLIAEFGWRERSITNPAEDVACSS